MIKHHQVTITPETLRKFTWNSQTVFWLNFEKKSKVPFLYGPSSSFQRKFSKWKPPFLAHDATSEQTSAAVSIINLTSSTVQFHSSLTVLQKPLFPNKNQLSKKLEYLDDHYVHARGLDIIVAFLVLKIYMNFDVNEKVMVSRFSIQWVLQIRFKSGFLPLDVW